MTTKNSFLSTIVILLMLLVIPTAGYAVSDVFHYTFSDGRTLSLRYGFSGGDIELDQKTESQAYYKGWIEKGSTFTATATISGSDGYAIRMGCKFYDKHRRKIDEKYDGGVNTYSCSFTMPEDAAEAECYIESAGCYTEIHYRVVRESESTIIDDDEGDDEGDDEDEDEDYEDYEEDNDAEDEAGSNDYIIPITIGILILGGGAVAAQQQKKKKKKDKKENKGNNEDDKQPDQLRMEVLKDFGDTLVVGDKPQQVSARIIRKPVDGPEYVDMQLTQLIEIVSGDEYLQVQDAGIAGDCKCAFVQAPQVIEDTPSDEGIINFRLASEQGSYTNHLHFKVVKGGIGFAQENLTFPNGYKKEVRLPFAIVGMDDNATTNIELTVTDKDGALSHDYEVELEWSEKDRMHFAVIRDVINPESPWAMGLPGEYVAYSLNVKAISPTGFEIEGSLPLLRFYMGINMLFNGDQDLVDQKNDVPCFLQLYDPVHHTFNQRVMMDKKEYTTAETRCWVRLWDYNDETGDVFMVEPVLKDDGFELKGHSDGDQELIDRLGMKAVPHTSVGGHIYYIVHCTKGVLNAPNRLMADIHVKAEYNGQTFEFIRPVRLTSQPMRHFASSGDSANAIKKDNETKEQLEERLNTLRGLELTEMYAPLVAYIELQLSSYNKYYGFDERSVKACYDAYTKVIQGEALADQQQVLANDSLGGILKQWIESYNTTVNDCPKWLRIFYGVASFGISEAVNEIGVEMKNYVEKGGDSFFGAWYVGAKVAVREYLIEKAIMTTVGVGKILVSNWNQKVGWDLAKKMGKESWEGVKETVIQEYNSVRNFGRIKQAAEEVKAVSKASEQAAETTLKESEKAVKTAAAAGKRSNLAMVQEFGKKRAVERLQDLQAAMEMAKLNPTAANLRLRNQIIMEIQGDKYAMMMLKNPEGIGKDWVKTFGKEGGKFKTLSGGAMSATEMIKETRKGLNTEIRTMYKETHKSVRNQLAAKAGIHPDDIMMTNASSNKVKKLLDGETVTFDQDITYYYYHPQTGEIVYFEQKMTRDLYNREFYNVAKKHTLPPAKPTSTPLNKETLESMQQTEQRLANKYGVHKDQTVIENVGTDAESYGVHDLPSMTDQRLWGRSLKNPEKVAEAVIHKGKSRFEEARRMFDQAKGIADTTERMNLQADALNEILEGCRSNVKTFDIIAGRDAQRVYINGGLQVSTKLRKGVEMMRKLTSDGTTDIDMVEYGLQQIGYSLESLCDDLGETLLKVG